LGYDTWDTGCLLKLRSVAAIIVISSNREASGFVLGWFADETGEMAWEARKPSNGWVCNWQSVVSGSGGALTA
jgi:hypothetical protein